jgi:hypothetical protein
MLFLLHFTYFFKIERGIIIIIIIYIHKIIYFEIKQTSKKKERSKEYPR